LSNVTSRQVPATTMKAQRLSDRGCKQGSGITEHMPLVRQLLVLEGGLTAVSKLIRFSRR
jgi:hypothetical protein